MEIRDLRVGNKVQDNNGFIFTVVSIHDDGTVYCDFEGNDGDVWEFDKNNPCEPIRLTEEILLKCGFIKKGNLTYIFEDFKIEFKNGLFLFFTFHYCVKLKSFHQLQNLYFALCNEELNVKL